MQRSKETDLDLAAELALAGLVNVFLEYRRLPAHSATLLALRELCRDFVRETETEVVEGQRPVLRSTNDS